jgi:hypothetical protein
MNMTVSYTGLIYRIPIHFPRVIASVPAQDDDAGDPGDKRKKRGGFGIALDRAHVL